MTPAPPPPASPDADAVCGDGTGAAGGTRTLGEMARGLGRFWTAANALSLARLVLVAPIAARVWGGADLTDPWLLGMIAVGVLTDFFDGKVARWSKTVSEWGKVLDPLADKAAAIVVFAALAFRPAVPAADPPILNLPVWLFAFVVARETAILTGATLLARHRGVVPASIRTGKVAIFCVAVTVVVALLRPDADLLGVCVGVTAALLAVSLAGYAAQFTHLWRRPLTAKAPSPVTPSPVPPSSSSVS